MPVRLSGKWSSTIILVTLSISSGFGQVMPKEQAKKMSFETNVGIPIDGDEFERRVLDLVTRMADKAQFEVNDQITLVRIWNTLQANKISDRSSALKRYTELFRARYLNDLVTKLHMTLTKGMAWYSEKYDLYLGGKPHPNSQYKLPQPFLESLLRPSAVVSR